MMCATCHGDFAEGGTGPALDMWTRTRDEMVSIVDMRMPLGNPERCDHDCASAVADYVLGELQIEPPSCASVTPPAPAMRLLTRREYDNTVRDLFAAATNACTTNDQCAIATESCFEGYCERDPCSLKTFTYDPGAQSLIGVVVAGAFNNWAPTEAQGGWPMTFHPGLHRWVLKHEVADGSQTYKLVLDGSMWIPDPSNPNTMPDGFGGQNSVLDVDCAHAVQPPSIEHVSQHFPVESRPTGYPFDNASSSNEVSPVHVDESMLAAAKIAEYAIAKIDRLLPCAHAGGDRAVCAATFVRDFGKRAFRRPLAAEESARYEALIAAQPSIDDGLRVAIRVMLSSPSFLYRTELGLDAYETASAMSYLFWATMPDDALFDAAARGELATPDGREREARRLLTDPKARETFGSFFLQWLGVESVLSSPKQAALYPDFSDDIRHAMIEETKSFGMRVAFDSPGRRFEELLTAQYTTASNDLRAFYGTVPDDRRAGFLTQGSVLATYAHSDQSSPIKRGVFVRERLLCQKFGVPPPDAQGLPAVDPNATTRERFRMHTAKESCRACHQYIDGVGFGFERFDAVGRWRETEAGQAIDASGDMNDVEGLGMHTSAPYQTVPELAAILASSESAKLCFATEWWRFARGMLETSADRCAVRALYDAWSAHDFDVRELMIAFVRAPAFVERSTR